MSQQQTNSYEKKDVDFWVAAIFIGALLVMLLLVGVAARVVYRMVSSPQTLKAQGSALPLPPEPRLEADPVSRYKAFRAKEENQLTHYGWVDRSKGIVRLPIDRALNLVAERGLPARTETK